MASIGDVRLEIRQRRDGGGSVTVTYDVHFDRDDRATGRVYAETCRLIGDDTGVGDGRVAGGDDTRGFLTPLFNDTITPHHHGRYPRKWTRSFSRAALDEDRGSIPNPDELRALVTLVPKDGGTPARRESNMVTLAL